MLRPFSFAASSAAPADSSRWRGLLPWSGEPAAPTLTVIRRPLPPASNTLRLTRLTSRWPAIWASRGEQPIATTNSSPPIRPIRSLSRTLRSRSAPKPLRTWSPASLP